MTVNILDLAHGGLDTTERVVLATTAVTARRGDFVVADATAGVFAVTLPSAIVLGHINVIVNAGAGVTLTAAAGETIDGASTTPVPAGGSVRIISDGGTAWRTQSRGAGMGGIPLVRVNTVAASGAAQTIPEPGLYGLSDITLTAATVALTFPAASEGKTLRMVIRQDGTGGRAVTWPANSIFPGGTDVVISVAASAVDMVDAVCVVEDVWMITRVGAAYAV